MFDASLPLSATTKFTPRSAGLPDGILDTLCRFSPGVDVYESSYSSRPEPRYFSIRLVVADSVVARKLARTIPKSRVELGEIDRMWHVASDTDLVSMAADSLDKRIRSTLGDRSMEVRKESRNSILFFGRGLSAAQADTVRRILDSKKIRYRTGAFEQGEVIQEGGD